MKLQVPRAARARCFRARPGLGRRVRALAAHGVRFSGCVGGSGPTERPQRV